MRTTRRWLKHCFTIVDWVAFIMITYAAVQAWVVFIASLNFDVYPSATVVTSLAATTVGALLWLIFFPRRILRLRSERRITDQLCEEAVKLHRIIEHQNQLHCNPGYEVVPGDTYAATLHGRLVGIRMAICILNGWDPFHDADKEGPADELVLAYWEKKHPADWESRA